MKQIHLPNHNQISALNAGEYSITGHTGLKLRIRQGGTISWRYIYRDSMTEKIKAMTLGRYPSIDEVDAVQLWAVARKEVQLGKDPRGEFKKEKTKNVEAPTINDVFEKWMTLEIERKRVHPQQVREMFNRDVIPIIGDRKIESIESDDIDALLDRIRLRKVTRIPVYIYNLLQQMFRFAKSRKLLIRENIFHDYKRPDDDNYERDVKVLDDGDIRVLWYEFDNWTFRDREKANSINKFTPIALRILLLTGLHVQEINKAKWSDIDLEEGIWHIPSINRKVRVEYSICISDLCKEQLLLLKELHGDHESILGGGYADSSGFRKVTDRILNRTKNNRWTPKDTRSTFATICAKMKVTHEIRQKCLGHSNGSVESRHYQKYDFIDERQDAFQRVANYIKRVCVIDDPSQSEIQSLDIRAKIEKIEKFIERHHYDHEYQDVKYLYGQILESVIKEVNDLNHDSNDVSVRLN